MIRDVREVVRVQTQVQRVQHEPAAGDAEVRLVVLHVVPAERGNAVAPFEAELLERDRELLCAAHRLAMVRAVEALVGQPRDDLAVAEVRLRTLQDVRERQLEVHHLAVHGTSSDTDGDTEQRIRDLAAKLGGTGTEALEPERALVEAVERVLPREAGP